MTNEKRIGEEIIGQTGAVTGFDTPDPKEGDGDPDTLHTTTPADDRVGAADQGKYQPVNVDPGAVTGQFDHLATRDPAAMEHQLQRPEFEGAESVAALGVSTALVDAAVPSTGLGTPMSAAVIDQHVQSAADPNPNYTPPSKMTPPHVPETPADLPPGETAELRNEVQGKTKP